MPARCPGGALAARHEAGAAEALGRAHAHDALDGHHAGGQRGGGLPSTGRDAAASGAAGQRPSLSRALPRRREADQPRSGPNFGIT